MIYVEQLMVFCGWVLVVFLGFSFLYESMGGPSYFPTELELPVSLNRLMGILCTVGGTVAFVWELIRLH